MDESKSLDNVQDIWTLPVLGNWSVQVWTPDPYKPPETGIYVLSGKIYGDRREKFKDNEGERIITSKLIEFNIQKKLARTNNSIYRLADIDPEWLKWLEENGHKLEDFNKREDEDRNNI